MTAGRKARRQAGTARPAGIALAAGLWVALWVAAGVIPPTQGRVQGHPAQPPEPTPPFPTLPPTVPFPTLPPDIPTPAPFTPTPTPPGSRTPTPTRTSTPTRTPTKGSPSATATQPPRWLIYLPELLQSGADEEPGRLSRAP